MVKSGCSGLVASSPPGPAQMVGLRLESTGDQDKQPFDLSHGQRDQAGIGWWLLVECGGQNRGRCAGFRLSGGDRTDRESGHHQHDKTETRGQFSCHVRLLHDGVSLTIPGSVAVQRLPERL